MTNIYLVQDARGTKFIVGEEHIKEFLSEYIDDVEPIIEDITNEVKNSWYEI